jgi:hypothetical protein
VASSAAAPATPPPAAPAVASSEAGAPATDTGAQASAPETAQADGAAQANGAPATTTPEPLPLEPESFESQALEPEILEPLPRDSIFSAGYGSHGGVTVAIGGLMDAVDPRAAAGASIRVPQFTTDARFGLGKGWSAVAHLNTILGINEVGVGASWSFPLVGEIRGLAQFQSGVFVGLLGSFGFESTIVAPQFRPLVGLSVPIGTMRWSLRGEIVFAGPYFATLGDVSDTFATPPPVANWNIALMMENLMSNNHLWYAGLIMMASTASYQNWLLFPDTANYDHYPRVMVGYEF